MNQWYCILGFDKAGSRDRRRVQPEKQGIKVAELDDWGKQRSFSEE